MKILLQFSNVCVAIFSLCARNEQFHARGKIDSLLPVLPTNKNFAIPSYKITIFIWYLIRELIRFKRQEVMCSHLVSVRYDIGSETGSVFEGCIFMITQILPYNLRDKFPPSVQIFEWVNKLA